MTWKPGQSGNPSGRPKGGGYTEVIERIAREHGQELQDRLLALLRSTEPTDRATFWRAASKRIASVDVEQMQPGNVVILVATGVPALLPSAVAQPIDSGAGDPSTPGQLTIDCEAGTKGLANGPAESNG